VSAVSPAAVITQDRPLHPAWVWGAAALLPLAAWQRLPGLLLVGVLPLLLAATAALWARYALVAVSYRRVLSPRRVAWGAAVTLRVEIENRKPLPLPWLSVGDELPAALEVAGQEATPRPRGRLLLRRVLAVRWYQRVSRRYDIRCTARGEHLFGPVTLRSGDLFGLSTAWTTPEARDTLLVLPRLVPLQAGSPLAGRPFGDLRARQPPFTDPLRTVGIRAYAPGDPLRALHWPATARTGSPQVRQFEPVQTLHALLFLDVATAPASGLGLAADAPGDPDLLELAVMTAAALATALRGAGYRVGLATNGRGALSPAPVGVPLGDAPRTAEAILEALARLTPTPLAPLAQVIGRDRPGLAPQTAAIVVSAVPDDALLAATERLRADGRPTTLVLVGDGVGAVRPRGVTVRHVRGERAWRTLPLISLEGGSL